MKKSIALILLLACPMLHAETPEGPCAAEKYYPGLAAKLEKGSIAYKKSKVGDESAICWSMKDNQAVKSIMEALADEPPTQYSYSTPSKETIDAVSSALTEAGIMHRRGKHLKTEFLEWAASDDAKCVEIIKAKTGTDLEKIRKEAK